MDKTFTINVDGQEHAITADPAMPLLYALINELGKKGPFDQQSFTDYSNKPSRSHYSMDC